MADAWVVFKNDIAGDAQAHQNFANRVGRESYALFDNAEYTLMDSLFLFQRPLLPYCSPRTADKRYG